MSVKMLPIDESTQEALSGVAIAAQLTLAFPHSVYTLAAEDIRQGLWRPIGPVATRFLGLKGENAVSAYEVSAGPDGAPLVTHQTISSPYIQGTLDAVRTAETLTGSSEVEFRLLRIPFLFFVGAWLVPEQVDGPDTIIPVAPSQTQPKWAARLSADELISELRKNRCGQTSGNPP